MLECTKVSVLVQNMTYRFLKHSTRCFTSSAVTELSGKRNHTLVTSSEKELTASTQRAKEVGPKKKRAPFNTVLHKEKKWEYLQSVYKKKDKVVKADKSDTLSIAAQLYYENAPQELRQKWTNDAINTARMETDNKHVLSSSQATYPFTKYTKFTKPSVDITQNIISGLSDNKGNYFGYDESAEEEDMTPEMWRVNYGTPAPSVPSSDVACGGCGAHLHCQDCSIPGYVPSEIFMKLNKKQLLQTVCQRCLFLKRFDTALQVNVDPDEYPNVIAEIKNKFALVILVADLTDFPCSIWPGIMNIVGRDKPVCVVGNKVDLLPKDNPEYLDHVRDTLKSAVKDVGLSSRKNIKHVALVSAKTGYGIEPLISTIYSSWQWRGDIYLVGCTNVGKSTLFNRFIQSDMCKTSAADIVQKATISPWPGTTLNLLKFPLLRPSLTRQAARQARRNEERAEEKEEKYIRPYLYRITKDEQYATLSGRVKMTFRDEDVELPTYVRDFFVTALPDQNVPEPAVKKPVFDPEEPLFTAGKWCYDTPGAVYHDQLLHHLTLDEIMLTVCKELIKPRSFIVNPGYAIFLAGLGRIDFIEGGPYAYFTVFSSPNLPVSVVHLDDADSFYQEYLGTRVLNVPQGDEKRLADFPALVSRDFTSTGVHFNYSCCDVVLSSAGWMAVTLGRDVTGQFRAYTPGGRGCYVREPAMLPQSVSMKGTRLVFTPAFKPSRVLA